MKQTEFTVVNQVTMSPESTVVLVGTAIDGPSYIPFTLGEDQEPHKVLGQSPLADAYVAARATGASNIIAYRINGIHSKAILVDSTGTEVMEFRSVSAADIYNEISVVVYPTHLEIEGTDGTTRNYFFDRYKVAHELTYAINRDSFYGLIEITAAHFNESYVMANIVSSQTFLLLKGGSSEAHLIHDRNPSSLTMTDEVTVVSALKQRIEKVLFGEDPQDVLERQPNSDLGVLHCGVIVLCDAFHDDIEKYDENGNPVYAGYAEILASFCKNKTIETGYGCVGVIGTKPIYDTPVEDKVIKLIGITEDVLDLEAYRYVQIVVGHTEYPELINSSVPISYAYGATQAMLDYYISMSNKAIRGFGKLNFEISKEDVALLTANGYTCIVPSIRRGFVPYYATSYSKDKESLVSKPHNLRTSQYVSRMLVEEVDYLIGNAYNVLSIKDAMEKAKGLLDSMVTDKIIRSYELTNEVLERGTVLNIHASLTPFSEIKSVGSVAVISFPQGVIA